MASSMRRRVARSDKGGDEVDHEGAGIEGEWDKDKLLDALHWLKQIMGVICGVVFGFLPITGFVGAAAFAAINAASSHTFYHSYLQIDEDDYGGHSALLGEGFMPSVFVFQLCWILTYSLVHY
ncbi:Rab5-interacting protein [Chloropicon primus]|uniref:Rab5-interacting protein n=1 Tax=Chloropicon primus TaxID=1764295 RepID=A0A5B8MRW3_9CHLO|nr:Rab5-interacting protein [Chloropicon primus]|eukprot:QDZ23193.1 Rab5-interacting protein [Chloropicon primus]